MAIGQNHNRMKKTGKYKREKRGWVEVKKSLAKKIKKALVY